MKIHNVFHVSLLTEYHRDPKEPLVVVQPVEFINDEEY